MLEISAGLRVLANGLEDSDKRDLVDRERAYLDPMPNLRALYRTHGAWDELLSWRASAA